MVDYFYATIEIGGALSQLRAEEFFNVFLDEGAVVGAELDDALTIDTYRDWLTPDNLLGGVNEEARYGEFPELEALCDKLGLPYLRCSDGWMVYCDGDAQTHEFAVTSDGLLIVESDTVVQEIDRILLLPAAEVRSALVAFRSHVPTRPKLPPFVIVN